MSNTLLLNPIHSSAVLPYTVGSWDEHIVDPEGHRAKKCACLAERDVLVIPVSIFSFAGTSCVVGGGSAPCIVMTSAAVLACYCRGVDFQRHGDAVCVGGRRRKFNFLVWLFSA